MISLAWPISDEARKVNREPLVIVTGKPPRKVAMPAKDHPAATRRSSGFCQIPTERQFPNVRNRQPLRQVELRHRRGCCDCSRILLRGAVVDQHA